MQKQKLLLSCSPVLLCSRFEGFMTLVTYTQCSTVCGHQSLYKVNNNWPCWGHSLPIFELPLFAVPLQRPREADYKSCHFPRLQLHNRSIFSLLKADFLTSYLLKKAGCVFFPDKQMQSDTLDFLIIPQ